MRLHAARFTFVLLALAAPLHAVTMQVEEPQDSLAGPPSSTTAQGGDQLQHRRRAVPAVPGRQRRGRHRIRLPRHRHLRPGRRRRGRGADGTSIVNSTISGNTAAHHAGAIYIEVGTAAITSSTIARGQLSVVCRVCATEPHRELTTDNRRPTVASHRDVTATRWNLPCDTS